MPSNLDFPTMTLTSNLSGGGTVTFDVPDTSRTDVPQPNPIDFWLKVMPTATEEAPD